MQNILEMAENLSKLAKQAEEHGKKVIAMLDADIKQRENEMKEIKQLCNKI